MHARRSLAKLGLSGLATALLASSAGAAPVSPPSAVPGWSEMLDSLRDLPDRVLAKLPEDQRNDPQVRAEVGRLALSAVAAATLDALAGDPDHPTFTPQLNNYITVGQPNADTNYRAAKITPGGTYRLRGRRGSMNQARLMETAPPSKQAAVNPGKPRPVHDFNTLKVDAEGRYDVILSPVRPKGYTGEWWPLDPATNSLLVRMVGSKWDKEREPTLSIERLDVPAPRLRPSAQVLEAKLRAIPASAGFIAPLLVDRPRKLREEGVVNQLKAVNFAALGGLAGQFYFEGAYDLKDDEALLIETPVPDKCTYRSLILTNEIYETTDWYNNLSSLNGEQAAPDKDGVLRVVVSAKDPGVANWLATAGYPSGVVQGRWMECSTQPVPKVRKLPLSQVIAALPKDTPRITPAQRDQQIRDRRAVLQQRPLW
ncbi:DUF1214 domain-containing protein [Novosphingobium sp. 9U]|uniref:DUF1214 domain-containing protein n=1 Tax=Novosphingobium sp. 9U TaxID=2653158 RepID=UPI0012F00967|nr:DUF1214 domain-containing protein [Novosphingobium sp. 9U]VWX47215.1 conserved exported hypothetical protein [Novosphingobium sp. 9U]